MSSSVEIKFCRDFLQQINRLSVEYPQGYVEKSQRSAAVKPKPVVAKTASTMKITLKKLGGGAGQEVAIGSGGTVGELRREAGKIFGGDVEFSLMYKGRPLTDLTAPLATALPDPKTPVYVSLKPAPKPAPSGAILPEAFWGELRELVGRHVGGDAAAEQVCARFRADQSKWN